MSRILSGRDAANEVQMKLCSRYRRFIEDTPPRLVVVQVGDNASSSTYIRQKKKACERWGFLFEHKKFPRTATFEELHKLLSSEAQNPETHGIILQLPLESDVILSSSETQRLIECIPPTKDADGLHTLNQGKLFTGESAPTRWSAPLPATALGVYRLLEQNDIDVEGKDIVVIGRSRLVGMPTSALLTHAGATVCLCHRKTENLKEKTMRADIVVVAAGRKHLLTKEMLHKNSIVVDVGIHVDESGKLCGDLHPEAQKTIAAYSPVPGGVGPMTVAGLMENTLRLALQQNENKKQPGLG